MKRRQIRMWQIGGILLGVTAGTALILNAFESNILYFFSPSEVVAGEAPAAGRMRLGGMVADGSLRQTPGTLRYQFDVTDYKQTIPVVYEGVLPDLFREGQGVVVEGRLADARQFTADRVLAKHDENYMPPEVADAVAGAGASPPER